MVFDLQVFIIYTIFKSKFEVLFSHILEEIFLLLQIIFMQKLPFCFLFLFFFKNKKTIRINVWLE